MKYITRTLILSLCSMVLLTQCKSGKKTEEELEVQTFNRDSFLANNKTLQAVDSAANASALSEEERAKTITSIKFDQEVYDFGDCKEGEKITRKITFTNTGKLPLVIKQAYGSCGCTVPTFDKEPIAPGAKGTLEIKFDSTNKPGANTKSVMVEANTTPAITTVNFTVKVHPKK
ncbi:MAG TPA: DUF1573 domain-containing protein [Chitinophagales bacterium]|nr:DUF1573 domain-containing protein [Chitinophagales bacterium]